MTRDDAVSPILAAEVFERDRQIVEREWSIDSPYREQRFQWTANRLYWNRHGWAVICPAVIIDRNEYGKCWGRWRIEHVKAAARMGKRAEPLLANLMALCQGHTEDGMKAGHVWATAHREEQREYLERANATA